MKNKHLFVYGSLMNDEVTQALLACEVVKQAASLSGYRRVSVKGATYPAIYADKSGEVDGCVLYGLTLEQWQILDEFEGAQYERVSVEVNTPMGEMIECDVYVFARSFAHLLTDVDWCNQAFRERHMARFLGLV